VSSERDPLQELKRDWSASRSQAHDPSRPCRRAGLALLRVACRDAPMPAQQLCATDPRGL